MNEQFTYIPKYVKQISDYNYGETITHEAYNALMNLNSMQGDYNTDVLKTLLSVKDSTKTFHVPYLDKELPSLYSTSCGLTSFPLASGEVSICAIKPIVTSLLILLAIFPYT